jgi:transposase InsO family protein
LQLNLNLSPTQLTNPDLAEQIRRALDRHGMAPQQLTLELTETAVIETTPTVRANLEALRRLGIRLSIDDFGTGYSSLNLLQTLRPDEVKIDQTFISAMTMDPYARRIVGWKVSTSATASFVLDALEQAIHARRPGPEDGLIHHSDRGVQYLAMNYTQRLAEANLVPSVGSVGDSYDNALAETINGLYKTEVIRRQRSWPSASAVEMATLRWVDWYNNQRLFGPIGYIPPAEAEANYYAAKGTLDMVA